MVTGFFSNAESSYKQHLSQNADLSFSRNTVSIKNNPYPTNTIQTYNNHIRIINKKFHGNKYMDI